jgi:hypothetical protein
MNVAARRQVSEATTQAWRLNRPLSILSAHRTINT